MRQPKNSKKGLGDKNFQPTLKTRNNFISTISRQDSKNDKRLQYYYVMGESIQDRMMYKGYDIEVNLKNSHDKI